MEFYAKNELLNQVKSLIEFKKLDDHIDTCLDLNSIELEINNINNPFTKNFETSYKLIEDLKSKYATIDLLDNTIETLKEVGSDKTTQNIVSKPQKTEKEALKINLNFCRYGIYVDVLIKHQMISKIEECIVTQED